MNFIVKNSYSSSLNTSQLSTWADNCHKSYRLRTLISFSNESSFPLRAFLSMTFMACRSPGRSLLSANLTWEKAPLNTSWKYSYRYIFFVHKYFGTKFTHGLLNRWTDIFILPRPYWGHAFNPNNATQTRSIFVKFKKNTVLGMRKVRSRLIFTLSMP